MSDVVWTVLTSTSLIKISSLILYSHKRMNRMDKDYGERRLKLFGAKMNKRELDFIMLDFTWSDPLFIFIMILIREKYF
jgi:hypothetical protein